MFLLIKFKYKKIVIKSVDQLKFDRIKSNRSVEILKNHPKKYCHNKTYFSVAKYASIHNLIYMHFPKSYSTLKKTFAFIKCKLFKCRRINLKLCKSDTQMMIIPKNNMVMCYFELLKMLIFVFKCGNMML